MNCKPGDLAIVVNDLQEPRNNGALVVVLHRANPADYCGPMDWECEAVTTVRFGSSVFHPGEADFGFMDLELRPIRDPGADAKDETLTWLPVPTVEVA